MRRDSRRARGGFTLPEVMVALVVSGLVLLGARATVEAVQELSARSVEAAREADRKWNGERLLRQLVESIDTGVDGRVPFGGSAEKARFGTRCAMSMGWAEPCVIELLVERRRGASRLIVMQEGLPPVELLRAAGSIELGYLHDAEQGGRWFERWDAGSTLPVAMGIRADGNLLVLPLGVRP